MILKPKPLPGFLVRFSAVALSWVLKRRFNKLIINPIEIKPNCSYLLMCNHFSFWDGFLASYLCYHAIHKKSPAKGFYAMMLKKQLKKHNWMRYFGVFSISTHSVKESLSYAAELLETPGNIVLIYPQGNLESKYVRYIEFKRGVAEIIAETKGECQIIWCSTLLEYFESLKPSVYFHLLDCGTSADFNFDRLVSQVNVHHKSAIAKQLRFTTEI